MIQFGGQANQQKRLIHLAHDGTRPGAIEIPPASVLKPGDSIDYQEVLQTSKAGTSSIEVVLDGNVVATLSSKVPAHALVVVDVSLLAAPANTGDVFARVRCFSAATGSDLEVGTQYGGGSAKESAVFVRGIPLNPSAPHLVLVGIQGAISLKSLLSSTCYS